MKALLTILIPFVSISAPQVTRADDLPPLESVAHVDLNRYLGSWYEIASYPQKFQKGCTGTVATYSLREDGDIKVENICHLDTLDGPIKKAEGKAWVTDTTTNSQLRVRFFWPFSGKYWIIDLGADYEYAVVGHPDRDYLWILSRTPRLPQDKLDGILARLKDKHHYDLAPLKMTRQKPMP